jgi:hypothetical protein
VSTTTTTKPLPEVSGYSDEITLYATRYKQGGRTVYSLDLSLAQVASMITRPDPTATNPGNRQIRPPHAEAFGKYIREHEDWIIPGMLLRSPNIFNFDIQADLGGVQFGILTFSRQTLNDLHILDGQHRILGVYLGFDALNRDLDKARSNLALARRNEGASGAAVKDAQRRIAALDKTRKRLDDERVSLQIFVESDPVAYRQMFFDIADNALGITASVRTRFDSRKVVNRALPLVSDSHELLKARVDEEGDRVGRGSVYLMGAKHVAEIIRTVNVGLDGRVSRRQEEEFDEKVMADKTKDFLDVLTEAFPQMRAITLGQLTTDQLRRTSLLGSVLFLRVLGGVYHDLLDPELHAWSREDVVKFFAKLAPHLEGPAYPGSIWLEHLPEIYTDGSFGPRGRRQDLQALKIALVDWALDKPKWLNAKPAPRPEDVPEEVSTEEEMRVVDEILARK